MLQYETHLSLLQNVELDVMMTDVHGFLSPFSHVWCENPLKNWTEIVSAFFALFTSSMPNGTVVPAALVTITAG